VLTSWLGKGEEDCLVLVCGEIESTGKDRVEELGMFKVSTRTC